MFQFLAQPPSSLGVKMRKKENIVDSSVVKVEENTHDSILLKGSLNERRKRVEKLMEVFFDNFLLPYKSIDLKLKFDSEDKKVIENIKKEYPELLIGGSNDFISIPLLIATITKILSGEEMRFLSDDERNICGVKFIK